MHTVYFLYIWTKHTEEWETGTRCETLHFALKLEKTDTWPQIMGIAQSEFQHYMLTVTAFDKYPTYVGSFALALV